MFILLYAIRTVVDRKKNEQKIKEIGLNAYQKEQSKELKEFLTFAQLRKEATKEGKKEAKIIAKQKIEQKDKEK